MSDSSSLESIQRWKDSDLLSLIQHGPRLPEERARDTLRDPEALESLVTTALERLGRAPLILQGPAFKRFRDKGDLAALGEIMAELEKNDIESKRLQVFSYLIAPHLEDAPQILRQQMMQMSNKIQSWQFHYRLQTRAIFAEIAAHIDEPLAGRMRQHDHLKDYAALFEPYRASNAPKPVMIDTGDLSGDMLFASGKADLQKARDNTQLISPAGRRDLIAQGLQKVIRFKHHNLKMRGLDSVTADFSLRADISEEALAALLSQTSREAIKIGASWRQFNEAVAKKKNYFDDVHRYSWEEAKSAVCAAWDSLDPDMGRIARRAFDEQWVHTGVPASSHDQQPMTLPAVEGGHPYLFVPFQGSTRDVVMLSHEMGHAIASYLSMKTSKSFTAGGGTEVGEIFSFMGEELINKELLKRAGGNVTQRLQVLLDRQYQDHLNITVATERVLFEKALYDLAQDNKQISYAELKELFSRCAPMQEAMLGLNNLPFTPIVDLAPLSNLAYPIARIMAPALMEALETSPDKRAALRETMEAGGTMSPGMVWKHVLGADKIDDPAFYPSQFARIEGRRQELIDAANEAPLPEARTGKAASGDGPVASVARLASVAAQWDGRGMFGDEIDLRRHSRHLTNSREVRPDPFARSA